MGTFINFDCQFQISINTLKQDIYIKKVLKIFQKPTRYIREKIPFRVPLRYFLLQLARFGGGHHLNSPLLVKGLEPCQTPTATLFLWPINHPVGGTEVPHLMFFEKSNDSPSNPPISSFKAGEKSFTRYQVWTQQAISHAI